MPPSKTCSQIIFLIFRHPLVPLFQQLRKSDLPFLSVKVNHCMCIETSQIGKTPQGPPFETKKFFLSPISLKFYVWDPLTIRISNFGFFSKKKIFNFFLIFFQCSRTPKKFRRQKFQFFWKKMSEVALLDLGKYQKEQSHEFWWT